MARIEWVEGRLREWGEWVRTEGKSGKSGYPSRSCLDPDWGIPAKGSAPDFKVEVVNHGAFVNYTLRGLSLTLQSTLYLHYVSNQPVADIALTLCSSRDTITKRIERAHAVLAHML